LANSYQLFKKEILIGFFSASAIARIRVATYTYPGVSSYRRWSFNL